MCKLHFLVRQSEHLFPLVFTTDETLQDESWSCTWYRLWSLGQQPVNGLTFWISNSVLWHLIFFTKKLKTRLTPRWDSTELQPWPRQLHYKIIPGWPVGRVKSKWLRMPSHFLKYFSTTKSPTASWAIGGYASVWLGFGAVCIESFRRKYIVNALSHFRSCASSISLSGNLNIFFLLFSQLMKHYKMNPEVVHGTDYDL